jgi:hypothetical protein
MAASDQLEIVYPNGEIKFYDLAGRGITNIGRHPENDVVINSPGVALFHAVLDHRSKPCQIVLLDPQAQTRVKGQPLLANTAQELRNWDTIEVDGLAIIYLETQGAQARGPAPSPVSPAAPVAPVTRPTPAPRLPTAAPAVAPRLPISAPTPAPAEPPPAITAAPTPPVPAAAVTPRLAMMPPDQTDEAIVVDLSVREWVIDVEQTATCQVSIANGGEIVATFRVSLEGLDDTWYAISPPQINLNEGERGSVTVAFSAPRLPTSLAGPHHFSIVVTSPNYPGHVARRGATLTLNPYQEFSVGEVSPRQQTIPYRKRSGAASISILNKGNSETPFRLSAEDDQRGCSFEFKVPGHEATLAQQAEVHVQPEETLAVPMFITPHARQLVGVGKHPYNYTLTTMPLAGTQTPRSVLGQVHTAPLIGPWLIALMALLMLVLIAIIFRPTISQFSADPQDIMAGEETSFTWRASQFASLRIDPDVGTVSGSEGSKPFAPKQSTTYKLSAYNLLTRINSQWFGETREIPITVEPVKPIIRVFAADKVDTLAGDTVTISWEVLRADTVSLINNGAQTTLLTSEFTGRRTFTALEGVTTIELAASNIYGETRKSLVIKAVTPTATPLPPPIIERFDVQPLVITMGQTVKIDWLVSNVQKVSIAPIPEALPPTGSISHAPSENPQRYTLTASNGQTETILYREVVVLPAPTATPVPQAPTIEFFTVSPDEVVRGSDEANNIELSWSVIGDYTNIQISGPDLGTLANLDRQGTVTVGASKTTVFILSAYNGDKVATAQGSLKVDEPTATPPPSPTPPPTATPVPAPLIEYFLPAEVPSDTGAVVPLGGGKYQVVANTKVKFKWSTTNASKVSLFANGANLGDQPVVGESTSFVILQAAQYQLQAVNSVGAQTSSFVQLVIKSLSVPPSPTNVNGPLNKVSPVIVTWDYDSNYVSRITGFRVYRANAPFTHFALASGSTPVGTTSPYSWADPNGTCGQAYYVTAVYINYTDVGAVTQETAPSTSRYYTWPCATPTPKP